MSQTYQCACFPYALLGVCFPGQDQGAFNNCRTWMDFAKAATGGTCDVFYASNAGSLPPSVGYGVSLPYPRCFTARHRSRGGRRHETSRTYGPPQSTAVHAVRVPVRVVHRQRLVSRGEAAAAREARHPSSVHRRRLHTTATSNPPRLYRRRRQHYHVHPSLRPLNAT